MEWDAVQSRVDELDGVLIPEIVLPTQISSKAMELPPHGRLLLEVLEQALRDLNWTYRLYGLSRNRKYALALRTQTIGWVDGTEEINPNEAYSFLDVCHGLDLDETVCQKQIHELCDGWEKSNGNSPHIKFYSMNRDRQMKVNFRKSHHKGGY